MSENEDTPPASPSWMQSQTKPVESTPPKSRKPRRTKAQMAEARVTSIEVQPNGYAPAIDVPVTMSLPPIGEDAHAFQPYARPVNARSLLRDFGPIFVATFALIIAILAYAK